MFARRSPNICTSIQCKSSKITSKGCSQASRSSNSLTASRVCWRRWPAHPRLADDCHYLAKPIGCQLLRTMKLLQFSVAADESRETALSSSLQTCPRRARARHLVDLHWAGQAPDRQGAQWLHGDETFGELQGKTSAECCPGSPTAPSALRDGSSGRRPCSPCGDRCQWTARPPRLS